MQMPKHRKGQIVFDRVMIVDWSAGNQSPVRPVKDAIWLGEAGRKPAYLRNRALAEAALHARIRQTLEADQNALIGFDFPFGYPDGFLQAVTGGDDPLALWDWLEARIEDAPKTNNRFDVAAAMNRSLVQGLGPFWGNGLRREIPGLGKTKAGYQNPFPDRRKCELQAKGAFTCWQLAGAGAVGSQVLMGLPVLARLRRAFPDQIAVWPFEPLDRPIAFVEIWPSLIDPAVKAATGPQGIRDAVQVTLLAKALAGIPSNVLTSLLDVNAPVEGWIAGLGFEKALIDAAQA